MSESNQKDVIIIGAGPSGLTLAFYLKQMGLEPLVLEAGAKVGHSWLNMPDFLALISYWNSNYLLKKDRFKYRFNSQVDAKEFAHYLSTIPTRFNIKTITDSLVTKVDRTDQVFKVESTKGIFHSRIVVNCSGYYSSPFFPSYPGLESTEILKLHLKDYKSLDSLKGAKNILIIGSRLSAGQILLDLEKEDLKISLSSRSIVRSMLPSFFLKLLLYFVDYLEKPMEFFSNKKKETSVPMFYEAKKLISNKRVKLFPAIKSFHKNSISFEDGETTPFDAVIFATGFKPKLEYLENCIELNTDRLPKLSMGFEALYCRNLFFLGLDHQRNIQSRFLRGIRNDAKELAELINRRFKS